MNRETIGRWESGKKFPSYFTLKRIHNFFGKDALPHTANDLGEQMKRFRMIHGLSLRKAARLISKHENWWKQMEEGKLRISEILYDRIIVFLNQTAQVSVRSVMRHPLKEEITSDYHLEIHNK